MNKQQIVEILVRRITSRGDARQSITQSFLENVAEEILALRKDKIADGGYTRVKASALRKLKEQARQPDPLPENWRSFDCGVKYTKDQSAQWQPGILEEEKEKCGDFDCFACYPSQRIGDEPV